MRDMDPSEAIPRARAAWAYSRKEQKDLAEAAGLKYSRVKAIVTGDTRIKDIAIEELWAIADAAGVPRPFMEVGFAPLEQPITDVELRVLEIDRRLKALETRDQAQAFVDELADRLDRGDVANGEETIALMRAAHLALSALAATSGSSSTPDATDATAGSPRARGEEKRRTDRRRAS